MRVTTSRYETNLWSTHINNVLLAEPIRRLVCWRAGFSKSRGLSAIKRSFLSHYPPPPFFWLSYHFSRGQNRKSRSLVLLFSENKRKRVLRRLCNPIQSCFLPPGKGGGKIRRPRPLYNFRAAQEKATKITRNNVLNNPSGLSCN